MTTVLLCRDGVEGRVVANELARAGLLDGLVVEEGGPARRRKVRRLVSRAPWWRVPVVLLDVLAIIVYGRWIRRHLERRFGTDATTWPQGIDTVRVADGNDPESVAALRRMAPELLLVSGTAILGPDVLAIPSELALNLHGGIVPAYRNVQSEFWAIANRDRGNLGISVLHLDTAVDAGPVALDLRLTPPERDGRLPEVKAALVALAADAAVQVARQARAGKVAGTPQTGHVGSHPTPGLVDLVRLAARRWR